MRPNSGRQTRRFLFMLFLVVIVFNHAVRLFADPISSNTSSSGVPRSLGQSLTSVNVFRHEMGVRLRNTATWCPNATNSFCYITMDGVVMILGLH